MRQTVSFNIFSGCCLHVIGPVSCEQHINSHSMSFCSIQSYTFVEFYIYTGQTLRHLRQFEKSLVYLWTNSQAVNELSIRSTGSPSVDRWLETSSYQYMEFTEDLLSVEMDISPNFGLCDGRIPLPPPPKNVQALYALYKSLFAHRLFSFLSFFFLNFTNPVET